MSSFKRKGSVKQSQVYPGTRTSPAGSSTLVTSTGIPSLDDILGGGLPLSCSLLITAPDLHSSYGVLVSKYFIAQGLSCGHRLYVVDDNADAFVRDIMWYPRVRNDSMPEQALDDEEEKPVPLQDQKIKIAWRYEQMKPFQTTVSASSDSTSEYCHTFDLTSRIPPSTIKATLQSGHLSYIDTRDSDPGCISTSKILYRIQELLDSEITDIIPTRICIPSLGSPHWGELTPQDILYFLHSLRAILRQYPHACASMSLAPHSSAEAWGGNGWIQKLGWMTDVALTLSAFSANPSLTATFPNHHGLLHIHTLPAPHTMVPPSDRFSALRGLSASAGGIGGSGENNLTFKSTRKRLIFETLHLDIEGGVGERRTTPSTIALETLDDSHDHTCHAKQDAGDKTGFAAIEVMLDDSEAQKTEHNVLDGGDKAIEGQELKPKKQKKKVAFRADRPDLYDF